MSAPADLARRLAREAEAVCRHYLSNGHRHGCYWVVGDTANTPGRSLYVRLYGADYGPGAAGKWTDSATAEHGDLLDLICLNREFNRLGDAMDEARTFLALPRAVSHDGWRPKLGGGDTARRLFLVGERVSGTHAETYLRARGITAPLNEPALRYHPSLYYRESRDSPAQQFPALVAAVTDCHGRITGIQRTWLDPSRPDKAPIADPRRALGHLLGNGVRFGRATDVLAAGEGIETMLALKSVLPSMPMIAGLSANHLAALILPCSVRRLYIARDNDRAGCTAAVRLRQRSEATGVETYDLIPVHKDFNLDLCHLGTTQLLAHLCEQFAAGDFAHFSLDAN